MKPTVRPGEREPHRAVACDPNTSRPARRKPNDVRGAPGVGAGCDGGGGLDRHLISPALVFDRPVG